MSVARRTILFLVTEDWYFVSHRLPLARAAVEAGYRVVVATRVQKHGEIIREAGCELISLRLRRSGRNPITEFLALAELVQIYRRVRPDIVHHVALKAVLYGSLAARITRVPHVVNAVAGLGYISTSEDRLARLLRPVLRVVLRGVLRRPDSWVILQNPDDFRALVEAGAADPARSVIMRGAGVDFRAFRPADRPPPVPVVMLATRMIWDKGVGEFVAAARQLRTEGVQARFILVGDPDPENPAAVPRAQLEAWAHEGVIAWWGHRADMPATLREASLFCFPSSYGEGIPKVLLEAAATGLPIVTTDAPGCREVVRHGDNGLLVPLRDARAVADAVRELLTDPERRRQMGSRSRVIAEAEFAIERVIEATVQMYQRLAPTTPTILLLVTEDWFVMSHWTPLILGARARGYHVTVATRVQNHGGQIAALGCEVEPLRLTRSGRNPFREAMAILQIARIYRRRRPDVVHHIAMKPVLYGSAAALLTARRQVVNAIPGLGFTFVGTGWTAWVLRPLITTGLRAFLRRPGSVALFENPDDRAMMIRNQLVTEHGSALIPGAGVDLARFRALPEPEGVPLVVLPGRMLWDKGVGEFVRAAERLRGCGLQVRFALVGPRDPANPASIDQEILEGWNAGGSVEWWGMREDMPEVFASASVICLPSYREGLPKALSEAAACGRPIVTTDVPGCREVVQHEVTGLLVPVRDPVALADALERLLRDPALRLRLGRQARARAEESFGEERAINAIFTAYAQVSA